MTESPSPALGFDKRRASDIGKSFASKMTSKDNMNSNQRRRTVGGGEENVPPNTKLHVSFNDDILGSVEDSTGGSVPTAEFHTPSKKNNNKARVSLGSAAASSYYFSDLPKTPLSSKLSAKKKSRTPTATNDTSAIENNNEGTAESSKSHENGNQDSSIGLNDTSVLSMGTSSSEESDLLNKSVLSDTTELTASNFVLQATSRQRFAELSKAAAQSKPNVERQETSEKKDDINVDSLASSPEKQSLEKATSDGEIKGASSSRSPLQTLSNTNNDNCNDSPESTGVLSLQQNTTSSHPNSNAMIRPSPSSMSRPSPSSARKLTQSLRKKRIERERKLALHLSANRSSIGSLGSPGTTYGLEEKLTAASNVDPRLSIGAESQASPIVKNRDSPNFLDLEEEVAVSQSKNRRKSSISLSAHLPALTPAEGSILSIPSSSQKDTSALDASGKSLDELFQGLLDISDSTESDADVSTASGTSKLASSSTPAQSSPASHASPSAKSESKDISERPMTPCFSPIKKNTDTAASFKLKPSSHKKLTPSKLSASPGRVLRSAEKGIQNPLEDENDDESKNIERETLIAASPPAMNNEEQITTPPSSPPVLDASVNPSFSLTPNSHVKLTPSKLQPSPRRVLNPKRTDSPAKNTRSASKRKSLSATSPAQSTTSSSSEKGATGIEIDTLPLSQQSARRETADVSILKDLFADMEPDTNEGSDNKSKAADESDLSLQVDDLPPSQQNERRDTVNSSAFRSLFEDAQNEDAQSNKENIQSQPLEQTEEEVAGLHEQMPPKRRRQSSASSISTRVVLEGDDNTGDYSATTANTADLIGLLEDTTQDLTSLNRSIQRDVSSMQMQSPMPPKFPPKGILNSAMKNRRDSSKRKVAFGSPEAAEYRIGSPSVSLTPMPRKTAKAMYAMPSAQSADTSTDSELSQTSPVDNNKLLESTAEIEETEYEDMADDATALKNAESSASPTPHHGFEEEQENEASMDQALAKASEIEMSCGENGVNKDVSDDASPSIPENLDGSPQASLNTSHGGSILSPASSAATSAAGETDDVTVELEGNLNGLLANTFESPNSSSLNGTEEQTLSRKTAEEESSPSDSVEMADVASIRSVNTPAGKEESPIADVDSETLNASAQKLNFEFKYDESKSVQNDSGRLSLGSNSSTSSGEDDTQQNNQQDGDTVELEVNMLSLLAATATDAKDCLADMTQLSHDSASKQKGNERLSIGSKSSLSSDEGEAIGDEDDDVTMELEENMSSLLAATGASRNSLAGMAQESVSKPTSNLAPPTNRMSFGESTWENNESSPEDTVELEPNMGALLQITAGDDSPSTDKPSTESVGNDESVVMETVEVEPSIGALVEATEPTRDSLPDTTNLEADCSDEDVAVETVEIEPSLGALLEKTDQIDDDTTSNKSSTQPEADESTIMETVQLEPSMGALLKTTESNKSSPQLEADESAIMETVQLEPSMGALLKTTESSSEDDSGDLTEDSRFSLAQSTNEGESVCGDSIAPEVTKQKRDDFDDAEPSLEGAENTEDENGRDAKRRVVDSNIESVLRQADQKVISNRKLILSESPLTLTSASRGRLSTSSRLSIASTSSRRFSMAPKSRLSLSVDESGKIDTSCVGEAAKYGSEDSIVSDRESPGFASVADVTSVFGDMTENIDLTSEEINSVAELIPNANKSVVATDSDLLLLEKPGSLGSVVIKEAFDEFLLAVCGEVEGKVGSSSDGEVCLNAVIDDSPGEVLGIQRSLRSDDENQKELTVQQLKSLSSSVKESVSFEWKLWETQVADALKNSVGATSEEIGNDDMALDRCATLLDDTHETIALMAGKAVRRARRRSMHRRKMAAADIEDEIKTLEIKIAELKANQEQVKSEESSALSLRDAIHEISKTELDLKVTEENAESNHSKFLSLDGLHNWTPVEIESTKAIFAFLGPSPKSCFEISLDLSKVDFVGVKASVNAKYFRHQKRVKNSPIKHTASTMLFLEKSVSAMVESVNSSPVENPSVIAPLLQRLSWMLGRLEIHANELTALQRRYAVTLFDDPISEKTDFLVSVEFSNIKKCTKLKATLELVESYPFTPFTAICLDTLEGEVDVDALNKQLVKSVKPGFRYLSRTCDIIAAFVG